MGGCVDEGRGGELGKGRQLGPRWRLSSPASVAAHGVRAVRPRRLHRSTSPPRADPPPQVYSDHAHLKKNFLEHKKELVELTVQNIDLRKELADAEQEHTQKVQRKLAVQQAQEISQLHEGFLDHVQSYKVAVDELEGELRATKVRVAGRGVT